MTYQFWRSVKASSGLCHTSSIVNQTLMSKSQLYNNLRDILVGKGILCYDKPMSGCTCAKLTRILPCRLRRGARMHERINAKCIDLHTRRVRSARPQSRDRPDSLQLLELRVYKAAYLRANSS